MTIVLLVAGLILLVLGGEMLVRGAVAIAQRFGVPPLVIGLTLVGFGTSTPELVTSVQAVLAGSPGIAVGNVVGSNIANVLLILGVAAILAPFATDPQALRRDGMALVLATLVCTVLALSGYIGLGAGLLLLAGLAGYLVVTFRSAGPAPSDDMAVRSPMGMTAAMAAFAVGLILTVIGARMLVAGAVDMARIFAVSEAIIGLTIVAVGTSLPELVTSAVAARRGQGDIAFGNVVGSNIFNILGILGVTAIVSPLDVPAQIVRFDIWAMVAATMLLLAMAISGWRFSRIEGAVLLAAYASYLTALAVLA